MSHPLTVGEKGREVETGREWRSVALFHQSPLFFPWQLAEPLGCLYKCELYLHEVLSCFAVSSRGATYPVAFSVCHLRVVTLHLSSFLPPTCPDPDLGARVWEVDDSWMDLSSQPLRGSMFYLPQGMPFPFLFLGLFSSLEQPCTSRAHLIVTRSDLVLTIMIWVFISCLPLSSAFVHGRLIPQHANRSQRSGSGPLL